MTSFSFILSYLNVYYLLFDTKLKNKSLWSLSITPLQNSNPIRYP